MRVFKTRWLSRYTRKARITDDMLLEAVLRAEQGLIDADLGGDVIKQRIARKGQGRSGGYRMLIAFRLNERSIFVFGFAKNERDNIDDDELQSLKELAVSWLKLDDEKIAQAVQDGRLQEVNYDRA